MRKRAYHKDIRREITHTFGRFMCIFLISALGVAFFTGIRVCEPDMQKSADRLFDESALMDIEVISTGGLTDSDIDAIRAIDGTETVCAAYYTDVLEHTEGEQNVIHVMSLTEDLNRVTLTSGRLPQAEDECLLDAKLTSFYAEYGLGDTISVEESGDEEDEVLVCHTFTIVGTVTSPLYLDFSRGSSKLGTGSVLGFIIVPEESFSQDYYNVIYVTGEGLRDELSYTEAYTSGVEALAEKIEAIADERCAAREQELYDTVTSECSTAEAEIADAEDRLERELADARAEIESREAELADAGSELDEAVKALAESELELEEAEKEVNEGLEALAAARNELDEKWDEYHEQLRDPVAEIRRQLIAFKQQISAAKAELEQNRSYMTPEQIYAGEAQIAAMEAAIPQAESDYADAFAMVRTAYRSLKAAESEYEDSRLELEDAQSALNEGRAALAEAAAELDAHMEEFADGSYQLQAAKEELAASESEARSEIADAREELADRRAEAEELITTPTWYVLSRDYVTSVSEFGLNANKIGAIGKVFPVIFFLVAILVCLTTMTRMVEEQRVHIGTMKALGYSDSAVAYKFIIYCLLASVLGSMLGAVLGEYILPYCIINAYYILYNNIPYLELGIDAELSVLAGVIACACTLLATVLACYRATHERAAQLMRPVAPLPGKRVFLERIGLIWKRLSFTMKASVRNLLRYAKRFWMTVIGIGGCMALMLVGFGLHDSIFAIIDNQFNRIMIYDGILSLNSGDEAEMEELTGFVEGSSVVEEYLLMHQSSTNAGSTGTEKEVYIIVPSEVDELSHYIYLGERKTGETLTLSDCREGVILNEKLANLLEVGIGDEIYLTDEDNNRLYTRVEAITENYVYNYVYMLPETYTELFSEAPVLNVLYFNEAEGITDAAEDEFCEAVLKLDAVSGINLSEDSEDTIYDMMSSLNFVVYVLVIAAALLAFVVLYNLSNININERRRELATLKVLGFYDAEVSAYVYRENIMLTLIGSVVGIFMGILLHRYVILTAEVDMTFFGREIKPLSYVYSFALTLVFAAAVNWIMHFKLKRIDMVESLKSVE